MRLPKRTPPPGEYDDILCKSNEFRGFQLVPSLHSVCQHLQGGCPDAPLSPGHRRRVCAARLVSSARQAAAQPSPDFLFGSPKGMIGVRSGWVFASAKSDLFTFVQRHLTVDRKDFNAPAIGVDVEAAITPRLSAVVGFDFARTSKNSEYRDFVDNQRLPITQTTRLTRDEYQRQSEVRRHTSRTRDQQPRVDSGGCHAVRRRRCWYPEVRVSAVRRLHRRRQRERRHLPRHVSLERLDAERAHLWRCRRASVQTALSQRRRALSLVKRHARSRLHRLRPDRPGRLQGDSRPSLHVLEGAPMTNKLILAAMLALLSSAPAMAQDHGGRI